MHKEISDRWLYLPIIVLGLNFIFRLVNQAQMMWTFPLDITNDWSSYIAQLFFLSKCGFHNMCPYWYNGFQTFLITPPGWFFFALPFYYITGNILAGTYLSAIAMFALSGFFIYLLCKNQGMSSVKAIALFLLAFGNTIAVGDFIRLGRTVSLFPFMLFIPFFTLLLHYRENKIDWRFLWFIPLYALIIMGHYPETILFSFMILGIFFYKKSPKQKVYIAGACLAAIALTSFWLVPFLFSVDNASIVNYEMGKDLWNAWTREPLTGVASMLAPLVLFASFYFYWRTRRQSGEIVFYAPVLFLAVLFFLQLYPFLPFLKNIHPDVFMLLFIFFAAFFFLQSDFGVVSIRFRRLIFLAITIFAMANVILSVAHTPLFIGHSSIEEDTLSLLSQAKGEFMVYNSPSPTSYPKAYYSYAPIYLNLSTASGWYPHIMSPDYATLLNDNYAYMNNQQCEQFLLSSDRLNLTYFVAYSDACETLSRCGFKEQAKINNPAYPICLYTNS